MNHLPVARKPSRPVALVEGLLATLIWASSYVLVKMGLEHAGPLTVAGLRYSLAALAVLPFTLRNGRPLRALPSRLWLRLFLIGLSSYTIGNGALFWALQYLPATTAAFLLSLLPLPILLAGVIWLKEVPTRLQAAGLAVTLAGGALFFSSGLAPGELLGIAAVGLGVLAFAGSGILAREVARDQLTDTLTLTAIPLALGGGLLLAIALPLEGLAGLAGVAWGIVLWLAVVNTACAYLLYNHSLQVLTALEVNTLFNLSPLGTAALAWLLLGERLGPVQVVGMVIVMAGVSLVQWRGQGR